MKAKIYPLDKMVSEVKAPSSAFCLHLEIICASLAKGKSVIKNIINSKDIDTTINWCSAIGAIIRKDEDRIVIRGVNNKINFKNSLFYCESATTAKLMIPLLCSVPQPFGVKSNCEVINQLKEFEFIYQTYGINAYFEEEIIRFEKVMDTCEVEFDGDLDIYMSAGILLALPLLSGTSVFKLRAPKRSEKTYNTITKILKAFSVDIKHPATMKYEVNGNQKYRKANITTEMDCLLLSHTALLSKLLKQEESIEILNFKRNPSMDEDRLLDLIKKTATEYKNYLFSKLFKKKEYDFHKLEANVEDSLPILMVLASLNSQDSLISKVDFSKKRVKKQYDIMAKAFNKLSIPCSDFEKEIVVNPAIVEEKRQVESGKDPYIVIALSYLALLSKAPIVIKNVDCVFNLYSDFFNELKSIGAKVEFIHN